MALHIYMVGTEDPTTLATAVTAMNVLIAAEIVAASPTPLIIDSSNATGSIAAGPLSLYVIQTTFHFN